MFHVEQNKSKAAVRGKSASPIFEKLSSTTSHVENLHYVAKN